VGPRHVVNGIRPGRVLCVNAGVHGDEYDGMEAVRRVVAELDPGALAGTFVGIPCLNVTAFDAAARVSGLDHANLNRIFPGDAGGSVTLRLADTFLNEVVPGIDALVDLHTGGTFGEIAPLAIVQRGHEELATPLGLAAGHEIIWKGGAWGGTARAATLEAGKPAITIEAGGGTYRDDVVDLHTRSVWNIMRHLEMVDGDVRLRESYTATTGSFTRAGAGGFFRAHATPGETLAADAPLGEVIDHFGHPREQFRAPTDGVVLWVRRIRTVRPGDEVVIFGPIEGEIRP
jgi:uncharacterized protein